MKKLTIKKIIEFKLKSVTRKKSFAQNLKKNKEIVESEGGGDYWISSVSAICNSYKQNDTQPINTKKEELEEKVEKTEIKKTKAMYKRNLDILYNYEDFDFKSIKPSRKLSFLKKHKADSILTIKGFQIQVSPQHVFSFKNSNSEEVGAIWFIAKLNGFENNDLAMFTDVLYRYLKIHFTRDFTINSKYCIAVDVYNRTNVSYAEIESKVVTSRLATTLDELKSML